MKTLPVLLAVSLLAAAPACLAQLKVDFDVVDEFGNYLANSVPESGFESFGATNQAVAVPYELFRTVTFSTASWGNVSVTMGSDANTSATNYSQVPRAIARTQGTYDGTLVNLAQDYAGIDTRATNGANPTALTLTLSALPAGQYELVSYHQDTADQRGRFDVLVNGTLTATNVQIHSSAAGQNPGANNPPFFIVTPFDSDGSTPTTISFRLITTNSALSFERLMVLNGFVVGARGASLLLYSFNATPNSVFQGQTTTLSWVTRSNASVYVDMLGDVTANTTNGAGSILFTPSDYFAPGTTNLISLSAQDTNTFESDTRSVSIRVLQNLELFKAAPVAIHAGDPVTLSWIANPGAELAINQGIGSVNGLTDTEGAGSVSVSPIVTTTYTMSVTLNGNTTQSNVTVTVVPPGGTGTLTNNLVAYWPMDELQGTKTPDLIRGYDLNLEGGTYPVLTNAGYRSNAFFLTGNGVLARQHAAGDLLPANKSRTFSISFWTKADAPPQDDRRIFAEASTASNNPLFTFDTMGGTSGDQRGNKMSVYIRRGDNVAENFHTFTSGDVFESNRWHHVVFVQSNGVRNVYVDAVLDSTVITNASSDWYTNAFNTTCFGGIKRASLGSYIVGFVDDAAIWNRVLSPAEVGELYLDGLNPNPAPAPLVISEFKSDFPAVAAGDTVRLSWNATSDATLSISGGIGDVTALSSFGVGSTNIVVNAPAQFTLTASRTGDTPVTRTISVGVVTGVASGWHLLDNFETYQPGPVQGQTNQWIQGAGLASVLDLADNHVLDLGQTGSEVVSPGGLLAALRLNSLSLSEGQIGTLFFRLFVSNNDPVSDLTLHAGISDHPTGFIRDWANNTGPYLRLEKPATLITNITVMAPDGYGATRVPGSNALSYGKIYNLWINVTNDVIASNDVFSVYAQEQGQSGRTLLHQDRRGDRNPNDPTFNVNPTLDKVFFALMNQNQARDNVFIDDIYLSRGAYLDTVPVPPGSFTQKVFLSSPSGGTDGFKFSWNSQAGATYTVRSKVNLEDAWQILATNYPAGGAVAAVTSYTNSPLTSSQRFYQSVTESRPALWSDDFEAGSTGWVVIDNSGGASLTVWAWGTPANGPGAAHSGTKAFGTDLTANYALYTDTALRSPLIDLTGVTNQVRLEFWQYLSIEDADLAQVNVLDQYDGVLAQPAAQQSGSPGGWNFLTFPLPAAALNQPIRLEFRMADADYFNAQSLPGWFIDDVVIRR